MLSSISITENGNVPFVLYLLLSLQHNLRIMVTIAVSIESISVGDQGLLYFSLHQHRLKEQRLIHKNCSRSSICFTTGVSIISYWFPQPSMFSDRPASRETGLRRMVWPWRRLMHLMCIAWFVDIAYGEVWWFVDIACGHRHRIRRIGLPVHYVMYWLLAHAYLKGYDNEHEDENTRATDELGV